MTDEVGLSASSLSQGPRLTNASFDLHRGEILGIYGLIGSGTTELVRALYGIVPAASGEIRVKGEKAEIRSPHQAMRLGMAMLPGNRKLQGVFLPKSLSFNLSSSHLPFFSRLGFFSYARERRSVEEFIARLRVKAPGPSTIIGSLSGGNQQKVVMARQLVEAPEILLVEEPTVGAKAEIHQLILDHAAQGRSAIVVSTDLEEIRFLSDRILVMRHGESTVEMDGEVSAVSLLSAASGEVEEAEVEERV